MSRLALYLLGPPRIEVDGEPVHIGRRKALALLAFLAMTPGSCRRDTLATLLWPDYQHRSARTHLRRALASLTRRLGGGFFVADRESIGLNPASPLWLDLVEFRQRLAECDTHCHAASDACPDCLARLTEAAELYRDGFMAGFTLTDSLPFDEWQQHQTEAFQDELCGVMERLSVFHAVRGEYQLAIAAARRWQELDPLHEPAHRRMMELYVHNGRRNAALRQYRTCVRALEQELGVPPSAETTALYERIRTERARTEEALTEALPPVRERKPILAFLVDEAEEAAGEKPVFVARERELARLEGYLENALAGKGGVVFITGGPGRGKTALMHAFAQRALEAHAELLVASGLCNAVSGVGDPFLPFRQVMGLLTGDVEARWAAGTLSTEHARRLWAALPITVRALLDHGPHLVDVLVPGTALLSRARTFQTLGDSQSLRVSELESWLERRRAVSGGLDQSRIFQQLADTLGVLAVEHPLLLTLDDLQWADTASASLLFHLGRHLAEAGGRVLIVGAYRPEEVALERPILTPRSARVASFAQHPERSERTRALERHPIQKVLSEFRRHFGDVWIDLTGADEVQGRAFVEAYVDSARNRLGQEFRSALAERTGGHPLFTIELLRAMQARGELVRDRDGAWIAGAVLDWERLPARVEAVIQERIERLDGAERDLLTAASVEGEVFTAQALAEVQGLSERDVLRSLSQELGPRGHRLVRDAGEVTVEGTQRYLSRYQFGHALFQAYLYDGLSAGERRLLHGEVAAALEGLYGEHTDPIAPALAHHYQASGQLEKAAAYALSAGDLAYEAYAYEQAIEHHQSALELNRKLGDRRAEAWALLRLQSDFDAVGKYAQTEECLELAQRIYRELGDRFGKAETLRNLGWLYIYTSEYDRAETHLQQAADISDEIGAPKIYANALHGLGRFHRERTGDFERARAYAQETLRISREIGDRFNEAMGKMSTGYTYHYQGDYGAADPYMAGAAYLLEENGWLAPSATCRIGHALNAIALGDYGMALENLEQARCAFREVREEGTDHDALAQSALALFYHQQGENEIACEQARRALDIHRTVGHRYRQAFALSRLGHALTGLGQLEEADDAYSQALALLREMGQRHLAPEPLAGLARVAMARDDPAAALAYVEEILSHLETGSVDGTDEPLRIYLTCYRVLRANDDPRAQGVLESAHQLLQARAAKIADEELRRSYLENVRAHRELVKEFQAAAQTPGFFPVLPEPAL